MDKKKAIWVWGFLILLFLVMIVIEIKQVNDEPELEEEIIYLSYEEEPIIPDEIFEEPLPEPIPLEAPVNSIPHMGRLSIPSVIINKKAQIPDLGIISQSSETAYVQDQHTQFLLQSTQQNVGSEIATQQEDLAYKIFQGQRFTAVLTHAVNSDLPGMVVAEISQDTYGYQSKLPLLPKGTRLIGMYNSRVGVGDTRLYIIWQRAITPAGIDIPLASPGTDRLGQSGSTGYVDHHFWQTFGTSSLLSVMAVGASNLSAEQGEFSNQYQQGVTDALMDSSQTILRGRLQRKPTIHIAQGEIVHVVVAKDLDFSIIKTQQHAIPIF